MLGEGTWGWLVFSAAKRATRFLSLFGWSSGRVSEFKPLKVKLLGDLNKFWGYLHNGNWVPVWFPFKPTPDWYPQTKSHPHGLCTCFFVCLFVCAGERWGEVGGWGVVVPVGACYFPGNTPREEQAVWFLRIPVNPSSGMF